MKQPILETETINQEQDSLEFGGIGFNRGRDRDRDRDRDGDSGLGDNTPSPDSIFDF
jgi:hypothetical protein